VGYASSYRKRKVPGESHGCCGRGLLKIPCAGAGEKRDVASIQPSLSGLRRDQKIEKSLRSSEARKMDSGRRRKKPQKRSRRTEDLQLQKKHRRWWGRRDIVCYHMERDGLRSRREGGKPAASSGGERGGG